MQIISACCASTCIIQPLKVWVAIRSSLLFRPNHTANIREGNNEVLRTVPQDVANHCRLEKFSLRPVYHLQLLYILYFLNQIYRFSAVRNELVICVEHMDHISPEFVTLLGQKMGFGFQQLAEMYW
jgi:hypothetical protein